MNAPQPSPTKPEKRDTRKRPGRFSSGAPKVPRPTPQQKRFIDIFTKNALSRGTKSVEDMLVEAGYSPESARQQTNVMFGIRAHIDPIVERIARHRERIMERMEAQVDEADYGQLVRGLDVTIKSHRLLTGKTTHNLGVLVGDRRHEIDRLIDE